MKNLLLLFLLAFDSLSAQQWHWLSRISYGYFNHSALSDNGKLYVAIGAGIHEVSANGATLAAGNYSGSGLQVQALHINSKGNLILGGYVNGSFTLAGQQWTNSGGSHDIFVAELTPQYQQVWSHVIGGTGQQELHDLGLDKNDNMYFTGKSLTNFVFLGKPVNGKGQGTSYVAKLSSAGSLAWVYADSSDNSYSDGKRISVNANGESLVSIENKDGSYYYFNKAQFYPASAYGDYFGLLLKSDGSVLQARSDKKTKASEFSFVGLTSNNWHRLEEGFWNGDFFSGVQQYDLTGDTIGGYYGNLHPYDNYTNFLGIVDDKPYFLCSYSYYNQQGQQFENYVSVLEQQKMKHLIKLTGNVRACHLHKRSDGIFVLDGVFNRYLSLGHLSMTTPSVGASGGDTVYYNHTFVAAFSLEGAVDIREDLQPDIFGFPNPTKDKFFVSGCEPGTSVSVFNTLGQKIRCLVNQNEIDVSQLSAGVYLIELQSGLRRSTIKFIKE